MPSKDVLFCAVLLPCSVGPRATPHSLEGPDTSHFLAHIFVQVCWVEEQVVTLLFCKHVQTCSVAHQRAHQVGNIATGVLNVYGTALWQRPHPSVLQPQPASNVMCVAGAVQH